MPAAPFDWEAAFGRRAPRILDVGCGEGHFLIDSARAHPERDHVGIDLLRPLIERAAGRAAGLSNVRFLCADAVAWLRRETSLDEIHIYHPQPYFHPDQAPLGLLTPAFFECCWTALRPQGRLVLQTDHKTYGRYLLEAARKHFAMEPLPGPWPDAPEGRTRREKLARRKGLKILRAEGMRRETPLDSPEPKPYFETPRRRVRHT